MNSIYFREVETDSPENFLTYNNDCSFCNFSEILFFRATPSPKTIDQYMYLELSIPSQTVSLKQ